MNDLLEAGTFFGCQFNKVLLHVGLHASSGFYQSYRQEALQDFIPGTEY